jgi:hypothetical protein
MKGAPRLFSSKDEGSSEIVKNIRDQSEIDTRRKEDRETLGTGKKDRVKQYTIMSRKVSFLQEKRGKAGMNSPQRTRTSARYPDGSVPQVLWYESKENELCGASPKS